MNLAKVLEKYRIEHEFTKRDLAKFLNVSETTIKDLLRGHKHTTKQKFIDFCKKINLSDEEMRQVLLETLEERETNTLERLFYEWKEEYKLDSEHLINLTDNVLDVNENLTDINRELTKQRNEAQDTVKTHYICFVSTIVTGILTKHYEPVATFAIVFLISCLVYMSTKMLIKKIKE